MPTFRVLSPQHRRALDRFRPPADPSTDQLADQLADHVEAVRARVDGLDEVLAACGRTLAGDLVAGAALRAQLLAAVDLDPAEYVTGLASRVATADGGTLDPRFRRRYRGPTAPQVLSTAQALLVAAAVRVARDPVEALAFALVAGQAADDAAAAAVAVVALRDGRTAPGDLVLPGPSGGPLRRPPDLEGGGGPGGGLGGGLGGPGGLGGGPRGGGPRGPDWHQMPTWITQVAGLRSTECVARLAELVAAVPRMNAEYSVDHVIGDDGCPGDPIELRGSGFGDVPGRVRFEATTGGTVSVRADDWSPTHLRLRVPQGAVSGPVGLLVPLTTVEACGRTVEIFRAGRDGAFHGGNAQVARLTVAGLDGPGVVRGDVPVPVRYRALPAARADGTGGAEVELLVRQTSRAPGSAPVDLVAGPVPPGDGGVDLDLTADRHVSDLLVSLVVRTPCGPDVQRVVRVVVAAPLELAPADPVELVQVVQICSPSDGPVHNAVALVEGARTLARVHVRARHHDFDWGAGPGVLPLRGVLTVDPSTTGAPLTVPLVGSTSVPGGRGRDSRAQPVPGVSAEVPYPVVLRGSLGVRADLRVDAAAVGLAAPGPWTRAQGAAAVTPARRRRVLLLRAAVPRRLGLATPTVPECQALIRAAAARLPVGVDAWDVYVRGLSPVVLAHAAITSTDQDDAREAWGDLLDDARDLADDLGTPDGTLVLVIAPASSCPVAGMGGDRFAAAQLGRPGTLAHEIAHAVGIRHAACRPVAGVHEVPDDPDPTLPTQTEVTGVDLHGTDAVPGPHVVPAGTADLMGYCAPSWAAGDPVWGGAPGQARWPSVALYERLRRLL